MAARSSRRTTNRAAAAPTAELSDPPLSQRLGIAATTALLVCTPLIPSEGPVSEGAGIVLVMLWMVVLAGWFVSGLGGSGMKLRGGSTSWALLLFLLVYVISGLAMAGQGDTRATINALWQWLSFGALFFLLRQLVSSDATCRALIIVMLGLAGGLAALAYYQYFYELPQLLEHYQRDPETVLEQAGINLPAGAAERQRFRDRLESNEPFATFALTNSLAGFLVPWLLVALGVGLASRPGSRDLAAAAFVTAVLLGGCLLLTKSRSAYVALCAGSLGLIVLEAKSRATAGGLLRQKTVALAVIVVLAVFGGLAAILWLVDPLLLSEAPKSLLYRWQYWRAALLLVRDHPLFGIGAGNFQQYYAGYKLPEASETVADPHNFLLEIAATGGLLSLAAWLALMLAFVFQYFRAVRARTMAQEASLPRSSRGLVPFVYGGAVLGGLISMPIGFLVGLPPHPAVLWLVLPLASLLVLLLHGRLAQGGVPLWLLPLSVAALLINLLAAGGISYPGVSQTLWVLAALTLNLAEGPAASLVSLRRLGTLVATIAAAVLVLVCHQTAFQPVLVAQTRLMQAQEHAAQGRPDAAESALLAAVEADLYWSEPWRRLAIFYYQAWRETEDEQYFEQLQVSIQRALNRNDHSPVLYRQFGDLYLFAYRASGNPAHLRRAAHFYRHALRLYPNNNILHAQLAWTYHLQGEQERAARQAAEALRLDALNPHSEQKLSLQHVVDEAPAPAVSAEQPGRAELDAEQLMRRLRSS